MQKSFISARNFNNQKTISSKSTCNPEKELMTSLLFLITSLLKNVYNKKEKNEGKCDSLLKKHSFTAFHKVLR